MSAPAPAPAAAAARRHEVILASAGSGKTWQLSNRVLALLLDDVPPEHVLATTFTRKAAGEILGRVLSRLAEAAASDKGLAELREALADVPGAPAPPDRARCRALLARLARRLDRFQVRTLDSYFSELARRYGHELGLPPGWSLVDEPDDARLREDAVSAVLDAERGPGLAELVRALQGEAAERSVHQALLDAVTTGHAVWLDAQPGAWETLHPPPGLSPEECAALVERVRALPVPKGTSTGRPLAHWVNAHERIVAALDAGRWEDVAGETLLQHALGEDPTYARAPIDDAWRDALRAVARQVAHVAGTRLARGARAWRDLLARFDARYRALQAERRGFRFDDLPRRLADGLAADLADGGAFSRMPGRVDHLLLDEFQDTSVLQWRVLRPLAASILARPAGARSVFCVGDVKQAIYAWREGESRLLSGLETAYPLIERHDLATSWRSSAAVLDTVNAVFGKLVDNFVLADEPVLARAAAEWSGRYLPHTAARERPGAARLLEVPADASRAVARRAQMLDAAAAHVAALLEEAPHASVAVLLRKGAGAARLLRALADRGIHASGERGNPLVDAASVRLALSALHLADHPADEAALLHLAGSPLAGALGLSSDALATLGARGRPHPAPAAAACAARLRDELLEVGYGRWLARLEPHVRAEPAFDAWERARFGQLVALGLRWDARAGLRPAEFADWVRATRVDHPAAAGVRVMTVHAAKGLEFDAVVLPDLDDELVGRPRALLAVREDPQEPFISVMPWPGKALLPLLPQARAAHEATLARSLEESLCVLYVAMTRARHRLDLLVQPAGARGAPKRSFATLVRHALGEPGAPGARDDDDGRPAPDGPVELWRQPDTVAAWSPPARPLDPDAWRPAHVPLELASGPPRRPVRAAPSTLAGGRAVRAADLLRAEPGLARARGSVIHRWMAEIGWLEDFDAAARRDELLALGVREARALGVDPGSVPAWLDELVGWLRRPVTRAQLERAACPLAGPGVEIDVWRERRFAVCLPATPGPAPSAAGAPDRADAAAPKHLLAGSFDRVVLARREDRPVAALVVDFKTDALAAGDEGALASQVEHHRPQMQAYRRALAALTGLQPDDVGCRLLFLAADRAADA